MTFKSPTQPLCRYCGKPIAKRTTRVRIDFDQRAAITSKADAQRLTNLQVTSLNYEQGGSDTIGSARKRKSMGIARRLSSYSTWDRETYEDEFFCNGLHAQAFGRLICKKGYFVTTTAYSDALARRSST